jgi:hypothetical protein
MNKAGIQPVAVIVTLLLLFAAAAGYLFAPAAMLSVVGIETTPVAEFLVRTLAAAFLAMLPIGWAARNRTGSSVERPILIGLALYLVAGSVVDLHAYLTGLVGVAALPSIALRIGLGGVLAWLAK